MGMINVSFHVKKWTQLELVQQKQEAIKHANTRNKIFGFMS